MRTDRFTIRATTAADATADDMRRMLQALLQELLAAALLDVRRLDLIVDHELAGNTAIRAVWKQLRRVADTRASRSSTAASVSAPLPSPSPTPEPASEDAAKEAEETPALPFDPHTPAAVIEMPRRRVA